MKPSPDSYFTSADAAVLKSPGPRYQEALDRCDQIFHETFSQHHRVHRARPSL